MSYDDLHEKDFKDNPYDWIYVLALFIAAGVVVFVVVSQYA